MKYCSIQTNFLLDSFSLKKLTLEGVGKSNLPLQYTSITSRLKKRHQGFSKEAYKTSTLEKKWSTLRRVTKESWANFMEDSENSTNE